MSTPNPPIHEKIPQELMSEIFCDVYGSEEYKYRPIPITLGLVCKAWRNITLATAALWTSIKVTKPCPERVETASTWLRRSKAHSCEVKIWPGGLPSDSPTSLLDILLPIISRLHTLHLRASPTMLTNFIETQPLQMPRLQELTIRHPSWGVRSTSIPFTPPPDAFAQCTSLRRLDIWYGHSMGLLRDPVTIFPWALLTTLELHDPIDMPADNALQIFCLAINLVNCRLTIPGWMQPPAISLVPCQHRFLASFRVTFCGGAISPFFIPIEKLPALTMIDVDWMGCAGDVARMIWDLHCAQPFKHLRNFHLSNMPMDCGHILEVIRATPTIDHLYLNNCYILDDDFLSSFIVSRHRPLLLPHLLSFYIAERSLTDLKDETIVKFVKSRWAGGVQGRIKRRGAWMAQIVFVLIDDKRTVTETVLEELRVIKEGGLRLTVPGLEDKSSEEEDEGDDDEDEEEGEEGEEDQDNDKQGEGEDQNGDNAEEEG
ncbi:hypothetical protein BDN72DRAFT_882414 [Pluteus cervinus]|uniref:Uncharacterized protein n=1 Tax=Pluteus cervinus TaxID=181527 RepID=A0ACD3ABA0_9AGAR|nr:hypothetical protein BDN72DRAFT_882414 [Pluteus cervinus]